MEKSWRGKDVYRTDCNGRITNESEIAFFLTYKAKGYTIYKKGFPDFLVIDNKGRLIAVEVKPDKKQILKKSQVLVMKALKNAGIKTYRYSPDDGLVEI